MSNKFENLTFYEINPRAREEELCCKLSKNMRDSVRRYMYCLTGITNSSSRKMFWLHTPL